MPLILSDLEGLFPCHSDETFHISSGTGWFSAYLDAMCRKWVKGQSNLSGHYITFSIQRLSGRAQTLLRTLERSWPLAIPAALAFHSCYHQNHGEKEKKQMKRIERSRKHLAKPSCWYLPKIREAWTTRVCKDFFSLVHKTSSQNAAVSLFSLFACLFHFRLWENYFGGWNWWF